MMNSKAVLYGFIRSLYDLISFGSIFLCLFLGGGRDKYDDEITLLVEISIK